MILLGTLEIEIILVHVNYWHTPKNLVESNREGCEQIVAGFASYLIRTGWRIFEVPYRMPPDMRWFPCFFRLASR